MHMAMAFEMARACICMMDHSTWAKACLYL